MKQNKTKEKHYLSIQIEFWRSDSDSITLEYLTNAMPIANVIANTKPRYHSDDILWVRVSLCSDIPPLICGGAHHSTLCRNYILSTLDKMLIVHRAASVPHIACVCLSALERTLGYRLD